MSVGAIAEGGLLERDGELAALVAALAEVDAESGGALALVHGEAGVGKTALVRLFCRERESTNSVL